MFFLIQFSINFPAKIRSVKGHSSKADHCCGGGSGKFRHCGRLTEAFHADFDAFDSNSEVCISDLLVHASVNAVFLFRHWVAHEGVDAAVLIIRLGALVGSTAGVNGGAGLGVHVVDGVVEVLVEFLDLLLVLLIVHHVAAHTLLLLVGEGLFRKSDHVNVGAPCLFASVVHVDNIAFETAFVPLFDGCFTVGS